MCPCRACVDIELRGDLIAQLTFKTVDLRRSGVANLRRTALEARHLQILVVVIETGNVDGDHAIVEFVAYFEGVDVFGLHRLLRQSADIENAGLVALSERAV